MSYLFRALKTKKEIDEVIMSTTDKVLVLRFGRDTDLVCMQLDETVSVKSLNERELIVVCPFAVGQVSERTL